MKNLKNRWNEELGSALPVLDEKVKNAPIVTGEKKKERGFTAWIKQAKNMALTACALVAVLCCCIIIPLLNQSSQPQGQAYAFSLEINPKVMFSVDEYGKIDSVVALNEDADVVLSGEGVLSSIKGKSADEGAKIFVDYCAQLGYLDITAQGVVKLTSVGETNIKSSLESYFKQKGALFAVVEEQTSEQSFKQKWDLGDASLSDAIGQMDTLFVQRDIDGKDEDQLKTHFKDKLNDNEISEFLYDSLRKAIDVVSEKSNDTLALVLQNYWIMTSPYNPLIMLDYWTVKNSDVNCYSDEFNDLMKEMESMLSRYENKYNESINSLDELTALSLRYSQDNVDKLTAVFNGFSVDNFIREVALLSDVLEGIGVDFSFVTSLPENKEEYIQKTNERLNGQFHSKKDKNKQKYETDRDVVSQNDYDGFISSIISEYGSLEKYWENFQS